MLSTERLARACARRPWRTVGAWVLALVLAVATIVALLDLTSEGELTSDPESEQGYEAIGSHFPPDPNEEYVNELILVRSASLTVDDPAFRDKVGAVLADVRQSGVANNAESFYSSRDESLVSDDRDAALVPVGLTGDCEEGADVLAGIAAAAGGDEFEVFLSGECSADNDLNAILDEDLKTGELYFGLPAALVVLVLVFGALVAALVPLVVAFFSIGIALGLAAMLSQGFDLSVFLFQMTTVMGLAIATDYGLFIVSRYREERAAGKEKLDAIGGAGGTANRAVFFSGIAFVLAMSGLLLVPDSILRSLGVGAMTVGLVAMLAALTLVPALLGLLGDRVNALRVPYLGRAVDSAGTEGRFWSRIARAVMRRPCGQPRRVLGGSPGGGCARPPAPAVGAWDPLLPRDRAFEDRLRRAGGGVRRRHRRQRDRRGRGRRRRPGGAFGCKEPRGPSRVEPRVPRSRDRGGSGREAGGRRGARGRRQPRPSRARGGRAAPSRTSRRSSRTSRRRSTSPARPPRSSTTRRSSRPGCRGSSRSSSS